MTRKEYQLVFEALKSYKTFMTDQEKVLSEKILDSLFYQDRVDNEIKSLNFRQEIIMSYTKNEVALETLISNINNQFYYIGEEDDKVAPIDVKKFTEHCVAFIDSLEIEQ